MVKPIIKITYPIKAGILACFLLLSMLAANGQSAKLHLTVTNIEMLKSGELRIGLFDTRETFKKKESPVFETVLNVNDSVLNYTFELPEGMYAIAVFHDENSDELLNTKALNVPVEGVGFSGILKSRIKPPDFEQACFKLKSDTAVVIHLRYPKKSNSF